MKVFKQNGVYHFRFMHRGKVVRKSTKQGDKRVAESMAAAEKTALAKGDIGLGEKPKVPTLAEFLRSRIQPWAQQQKATTATWYASGIKPLLAYEAIANRGLDQITSEHIAGYAAHRQSAHAVGTINRELRVLRRCLRLAEEWGVIAKAPDVSMAGAEIRRERVVGDREFQKYLTCASPLLADVAIVLNETGLRPEECHRLEWSDIDFGERGSLLIRHGKTAAARRRLPLTVNVRGIMESRWQAAGQPETGFVFPSASKSGHIEHWTLKKQHRIALKRSGVRPFLLYSLRHSFATRLGLAPGMDAWTLCKIMGWSSLSVAMTYVHADNDRVLAAFGSSRISAQAGHEFGHIANLQLGIDSSN
jgi:integrase